MTQELEQAFERRWEIYGNQQEKTKALCRDFFEAGAALANIDEEAISMSDFEAWWTMYDKKRGKEKCKQKWKRLKAAERRACLDNTPAYVQSTPDKQYRKDPITFLNNKSWNDEIIFKPRDETAGERLASLAAFLGKG